MNAKFAYSSSHKVLPHKDIRVEFTGKNLTKFSGMNRVRKFLIRFKVKEELESAVSVNKRDGKFSAVGMLKWLLYAVILDLHRQSDTLCCPSRFFEPLFLIKSFISSTSIDSDERSLLWALYSPCVLLIE